MKKAKLIILMVALVTFNLTNAQEKASIALVSIDTKDLTIDAEAMSNLVRLELEKIDRFEVFDKYDVTNLIKEQNLNPENIYGKTAVVEVGKLLNAKKMLTGSAERYGEKIILILRMIDVSSERIETTSVMEFLNIPEEIQTMVLITLNELMGIENDPHLVDLLIDYNLPITSSKTNVNLSGPRMGVVYYTGQNGKRLQAPKSEGGYDMFPVATVFGYQFEKQYLSSGDFQALVEVIGSFNGLETGQIVPSVTLINGFRFNKSGWEFGLGPVVRAAKVATGYYDASGKWHLEGEEGGFTGYPMEEAIDSRGTLKPSLSMILGIGKTFRSGYLNMPLNIYISPRKNGNIVGISFGFNTQQKPDLKKK